MKNHFVLDASVTLSWFLEDEFAPKASEVRSGLDNDAVPVVPYLWSIETSQVVLKAYRRGRIPLLTTERIHSLLKLLPVEYAKPSRVGIFDKAWQ